MELKTKCDCGGSFSIKMMGELEVLLCNKCLDVHGYTTNNQLISNINNNDVINYDNLIGDIELDKIYNEKSEITISRMKDKSIDYVITSPPYNAAKKGVFKYSNKRSETNKKYKSYSDDLKSNSYYNWQVKIINSLLRVTKYHIFYNIQLLSDNKIEVIAIMDTFRYFIKDIIIWKKIPIPHIQKGILNTEYEFIIVFSNDKPELKKFSKVNFVQGKLSNLIQIGRDSKKYSQSNKATFPVNLVRWFLINFCQKGEIIYDPYMGTGTTGFGCKLEDMHYIGSEIDKDQVDLSIKRIENIELTLF